jgi:hypothetical protein
MQDKKTIKMTFVCNQDWDTMKVTHNGRYCDVCKKEVFNFANKSVAEINTVKSAQGELCGRFKIEQVETDLIPIDFNVGKKLKYIAASVATFFGLELSSAKAQTENQTPTEITSENNNTTTNENIVNGQCVNKEEDIDTIIDEHDSSFDRPAVRRKHKYYLSKRFPFIKKRRRHVVGALF